MLCRANRARIPRSFAVLRNSFIVKRSFVSTAFKNDQGQDLHFTNSQKHSSTKNIQPRRQGGSGGQTTCWRPNDLLPALYEQNNNNIDADVIAGFVAVAELHDTRGIRDHITWHSWCLVLHMCLAVEDPHRLLLFCRCSPMASKGGTSNCSTNMNPSPHHVIETIKEYQVFRGVWTTMLRMKLESRNVTFLPHPLHAY